MTFNFVKCILQSMPGQLKRSTAHIAGGTCSVSGSWGHSPKVLIRVNPAVPAAQAPGGKSAGDSGSDGISALGARPMGHGAALHRTRMLHGIICHPLCIHPRGAATLQFAAPSLSAVSQPANA